MKILWQASFPFSHVRGHLMSDSDASASPLPSVLFLVNDSMERHFCRKLGKALSPLNDALLVGMLPLLGVL